LRGRRHAALALALASLVGAATVAGGCVEWLEVSEEGEEPVEAPTVAERLEGPRVLPAAPPDPGGTGLLVPRTPGLRVPAAGYWTRARLDIADLVLPYTWADLAVGRDLVVLRVEAARRPGEDFLVGPPSFHAIIPIATPPGTGAAELARGLTLGADALTRASVALRTSPRDTWRVTLTRLTVDEVGDHLIRGSLEGIARRGTRGQRTRTFEAAFLALRAPDPEAFAP